MQQVHQEEEEEVVEQQEPKPLTKAKRNKLQAIDLISLVHSVQLDDDEDEIYDSCPVVAEKITRFLKMDGVNKKIFLEHAIDQKDGYVQLKAFVDGSNQAECANKTYGKAYIFFERLRLLEGREKSEERLRNEALYPYGISTNKPDAQIVSHNLLHKGADRCEGSDEMDEEDSDSDSETDLRCYDHFA
ncbi:hypothetical protein QTG54_011000 [Skeletonema marinoi]|uniref:Uncharacterized protein n=1 Tax=Skeletonema marinoi TaxID=267567 RepID=A0AAD8Y3W5_9STRA|nr:hypothetical protein QTG54_011000 [Skeletonema marinoi]